MRVKLMGRLKSKTPEGGALALPDGATVEDALSALDVPRDAVKAVSINDDIQNDLTRTLADGDELVVLAPVAGG